MPHRRLKCGLPFRQNQGCPKRPVLPERDRRQGHQPGSGEGSREPTRGSQSPISRAAGLCDKSNCRLPIYRCRYIAKALRFNFYVIEVLHC
jgi:hypothetical protein